jgi:TonB family protein
MTPAPIDKRLREHEGDLADLCNRAGEMVRAIQAPPATTAAADARILGALRGAATDRQRASLPRLALQLGTAVLVAATGVGAAAGIARWARHTPYDVPGESARGTGEWERPRTHQGGGEVPPVPPVAAPGAPPAARVAAAPPSVHPVFEKAVRLTDPQRDPNRVRVPADLARPGATFSALVQVCISATGVVTSASVVEGTHPRLDPQIPRTLKRWRYAPARQNGQPISSCPPPFRYRIDVPARNAGPPPPQPQQP